VEHIQYEVGTGDRFVLRVFDSRTGEVLRSYGGDSVSALYRPQAMSLRRREQLAGFRTELMRCMPDGTKEIEPDVSGRPSWGEAAGRTPETIATALGGLADSRTTLRPRWMASSRRSMRSKRLKIAIERYLSEIASRSSRIVSETISAISGRLGSGSVVSKGEGKERLAAGSASGPLCGEGGSFPALVLCQ